MRDFLLSSIALIFLAFLSACGESNPLIGTWEQVDAHFSAADLAVMEDGGKTTYTFTKDKLISKVGDEEFYSEEVIYKHESGIWSVCEADGGICDPVRVYGDGTRIEIGEPGDSLTFRKVS
jgi:hypothetical protein